MDLARQFPHSFILPAEFQVRRANWTPPPPPIKRDHRRKQNRVSIEAGLKLERLVGKGLWNWAKNNPGWKYEFQHAMRDPTGALHVPDHVLVGPTFTFCIETKLTFTTNAIEQLFRYAPLISSFFQKPTILCVCAQVLHPRARAYPLVEFSELLTRQTEGPFLWHLWRPAEFLAANQILTPDLPVIEDDFLIPPKREPAFRLAKR